MSDVQLFVNKEIEKVATFKMSQDVNEWDENVMESFHDEYPELGGDNVEVVFKKTDPHRGYGYGYIGLGKEAMVQIPLIVKEYELSPMDVMLHEGQAYPLTKESAKSLLHKTGMGKVIEAPKAPLANVGPNISQRIYPGVPWTGGQYKYASVLSAIDLTQTQVDDFKSRIEANEATAVAWNENECKGILKIAGAVQADTVKSGEGHPLVNAFIKGTPEEAGYGVVELPGKYEVKGLSGIKYTGCVFPKVYDFYLRPQGVMIFARGQMDTDDRNKMSPENRAEIDYSGYCSVQQDIVGKKLGCLAETGIGPLPSVGSTGCFVIKRGKSAMAFIPVKIQSKSRIDEARDINYSKGGQHVNVKKNYHIDKYTVTDSFGAVYRVVVSPNVTEAKVVNSMVMLPRDTTFMSLGSNMIKLSEKVEQTKTASVGTSVTVRHLGGEGFSVEAPWAEDWAKEGGLKCQMNDYLSQYYTADSLTEVFEKCASEGKIDINDRLEKAPLVEKYAGAEKIARDLTKEAASIKDMGLADTVLSLQFINKDNVEKYMGFLPQLEKAASHLADMLVGARLGMEVEEYPIKTAMENLVEVVEDLRLMKGK